MAVVPSEIDGNGASRFDLTEWLLIRASPRQADVDLTGTLSETR